MYWYILRAGISFTIPNSELGYCVPSGQLDRNRGNTILVTMRKSPAVELMTSKRCWVLVNRTVGGSPSFVDSTKVDMVDVDGTADEAETDGDVADLDVVTAMASVD